MIRTTLPWPPPALSPNVRQHWRKLAKAKAEYRELCAVSVRGLGGRRTYKVPDGPLHLKLEFCPPTRRKYDRDNLLSRMKSGLDAVCTDALGFDDSRIDSITLRCDESGGKPGSVKLTLTEADMTHVIKALPPEESPEFQALLDGDDAC